MSFLRCVPDCVLHRHDLLRDPDLLPRGRHGPVPRGGGDDAGVAALPHAQGGGGGHHDGCVLSGHLLLCHHCLDILLSLLRLFCLARPALGHMW